MFFWRRLGYRGRYPAQNMPRDYECSTCKLGFTLGTHHFHIHDDGYFGQTSLVCSACGLQHVIEIPMRDSGVPIRLSSMPELLIDCEKLRGTKLLFPRARLQNATTIDSRDTIHLRCHGCGASGTLVSELRRDNRTCPNCKSDALVTLTDWMN
jgi:DNA-directed RNA polymerase subunit RPC12/RpoP